MKRCPLCDKVWEPEKMFCPWDGHRLKEMTGTAIMVSGKKRPAEPQFGLISGHLSKEQLMDSLSHEKTETQNLVDVALHALERRREHDQSQIREAVRLIEMFNLYSRVTRYFVDNLKKQSGSFDCKIEHKDEYDRMWLRFTLSFGDGPYQRTFPVTVMYHREPAREVTYEIDLYQIGEDKETRHFRTEKAGGTVETTINGYDFLLKAPRNIEGIELLRWLERSFKKIFKLAYAVD